MGEIIKVLSEGELEGKKYCIELNKPHAVHMPDSVHMQTDDFRWELSDAEFLHLSTIVMAAAKRIKEIKEI
jgi:hypothetical protein